MNSPPKSLFGDDMSTTKVLCQYHHQVPVDGYLVTLSSNIDHPFSVSHRAQTKEEEGLIILFR